ncbi:unnamed protein product [Fraxinus pennsylvanica]|uniref:F-box domain-containing protein n=1 Tax=Fraxinus pennsylvanica TaxID=56036 RepID=A0AAD2ACW4_9LAMI|nr:unnamed protein product [Fraxinus pennsylvanica]
MNATREILDSDNLFDRLPDDIALSIFSKLGDAKSLCISLSVCKRFRSINLEIDQIFLSIPRKRTLVRDCETPTSFLKNLVFSILIKPVQFISQRIKFEKNKNDDEDYCPYYPPSEVLKSFQEIRVLHLRLPCHGSEKLGSKAGAKSWIEKPENGDSLLESDTESSVIDDHHDHELKLRILWTISCLMAASARHYLIQEIVKEREMIEKIEKRGSVSYADRCSSTRKALGFLSKLLQSSPRLPPLHASKHSPFPLHKPADNEGDKRSVNCLQRTEIFLHESRSTSKSSREASL